MFLFCLCIFLCLRGICLFAIWELYCITLRRTGETIFDILRHLSVDCCCFYWIHLLLATRHLWARHQHWTEYRWNQWRKESWFVSGVNVLVYRGLLSNNRCQVMIVYWFSCIFSSKWRLCTIISSYHSNSSVICQNDRTCHSDSCCWNQVKRRSIVDRHHLLNVLDNSNFNSVFCVEQNSWHFNDT